MPWAALSVLGLLAGCAGAPTAPVSEHTKKIREPETKIRLVVAGDTLYSIAWESGLDYRELANWNRIPAPYTIRPGQRIRLNPPETTTRAGRTDSLPETAVSIYVVRRGDTLYSIARKHRVRVPQIAGWNRIRRPYRIYPGQKLHVSGTGSVARQRDTATKTPHTPARKGREARAGTAEASAPIRAGAWSWPARGPLLERFNASSARKGIDIAGRQGQTITAAANGNVVYKGSGLRGYGQLIILKHNDDFLSAYAHCHRIVVKEGDMVKRGQKIAEMGSSGTNRTKLHFEIRYRGKPVNPLKHLPGKP